MSSVEVVPISPREQWLEERRRGIGGSDCASLFPEDTKYGCTLKLYFDKINQLPDFLRTPREERILRRGVLFEDIIATLFCDETGLQVRRQKSREMPGKPYMRVNMDRQVINITRSKLVSIWPQYEELLALPEECGPGYLECKTANSFVYRRMMQPPDQGGGLPIDYVLQLQHGLAVTGYRWGVFAVLEPGSGDFVAFPMTRRENLIQEIIRRAESFWAWKEAGKAPSPLEKPDSRCSNCLFRKTCPLNDMIAAGIPKDDGEYQTDDSLAELACDLREAKEMLAEKQELVDTITDVIKEKVGDRQRISIPSAGMRIRWTYSKPRVSWDTKALDAAMNDEFKSKYKKAGSPVRSFYIEAAI